MISGCGDSGNKNSFSITCFDAEKGDAFFIKGRDFAALIDTGYKKDADEIIAFLSKKKVNRLDLLIISHFDKDHVGGASKILKHIPVSRVITTNRTNSDKRTEKFFETADALGLDIEVPSSDISIYGGGLGFLIIPPGKKDYPDSDDNNSSLIVKVSGESGSMLFTGDAEDYRLSEILDRSDMKCDVLKMPAHGRDFRSFDSLMEITDPKIAVITSSKEEPPSDKVISALKERGIDILDPGDPGSITLFFNESGIDIQ